MQLKKRMVIGAMCMVVGLSSLLPAKAASLERSTPVKCSVCGGTAYEYSQEDGLHVVTEKCGDRAHVPECRLTITYVKIYNVTECVSGHVTKKFSGLRELSQKHIGYVR